LKATRNVAKNQRRIPFLWIMGILGISVVCAAGCGQTATEPLTKGQIGTVVLAVDFGGQWENIDVQIPCSEDSTVFDILRRAEMNGDLRLQSSGRGETAFVKSINGVGGLSGDDNYWTYQLNGELGSTGSGVTEVDPGDELLWSYGPAPSELTR